MEEQTKRKSIILEIDEAKGELVYAINNIMEIHNLPCYVMDMLLSDIYVQIKEGAKNELAMAKSQMENKEA